jgi:hypothetical protein
MGHDEPNYRSPRTQCHTHKHTYTEMHPHIGHRNWIVWFAENFLDAEYTWSQQGDDRVGTLAACHAHEMPWRVLFRIHKLQVIRKSDYMAKLRLPEDITPADWTLLNSQIGTFLKVLISCERQWFLELQWRSSCSRVGVTTMVRYRCSSRRQWSKLSHGGIHCCGVDSSLCGIRTRATKLPSVSSEVTKNTVRMQSAIGCRATHTGTCAHM